MQHLTILAYSNSRRNDTGVFKITMCVFVCRNDTGVFVSDVVKGGVAEADGRLQPGDQILSVNGEDLKNATQEIAAGVLKVKFVHPDPFIQYRIHAFSLRVLVIPLHLSCYHRKRITFAHTSNPAVLPALLALRFWHRFVPVIKMSCCGALFGIVFNLPLSRKTRAWNKSEEKFVVFCLRQQ